MSPKVAKDVVTFSKWVAISSEYVWQVTRILVRPFSRFGLVPIGGRSTAIKLKAGGVWVLASTPLDTETKTRIDALGPVKYALDHASLAQTLTPLTSDTSLAQTPSTSSSWVRPSRVLR